MATPPDTLAKARARLLVRAPFFGALALGLEWVDAPAAASLATDGRRVWFSRAWCDGQGAERVAGTIALMALKVANKHHLRIGAREIGLWNRASDLVLGRLLHEDGFPMPEGFALDRDRDFAGLPVETVYERLLEQARRDDAAQAAQPGTPASSADAGAPGQGSGERNDAARGDPGATPPADPAAGEGGGSGTEGEDAQDSGSHGGGDASPGPDGAENGAAGQGRKGCEKDETVPAAARPGEVRPPRDKHGKLLAGTEAKRAEADLDVRLRQALAAGRRAGRLNPRLREMVEAAADRVDWRDKLRTVFDGGLRGEASWRRPNRRFVQHGLYLPGWSRAGAGCVVFVLDTSGSITARELAAYVANVVGVIEETGPRPLILLQCDVAVQRVSYLEPGETLERIEVVGRGGTLFQPAFDWIAANAPQARAIIYATDLACGDAPRDPGTPVIWLTPHQGTAMPFGEVVRIAP